MKEPNWRKCILNADSRDVIKRIPDNSIDFILTDPPYNLGKHSTGNIPLPDRTAMNNDVADWDKIDFNPEEWVDDFIRILKPTGNLFIFTSYNQLGRWYNCLDHKFDTTNFMIWHKTNPTPKIFKAGFLNSCEMIFTCWNKRHTWNFISQAEMHNFIESPICMRPERLSNPKHPTQKPVSILKKMIEIASNENDIVFDPFMGVGSTGVAALKLGRRFIGVEVNPEYCKAACQRVNSELQSQNNVTNSKNYSMYKDNPVNESVNEGLAVYQTSIIDLGDLFDGSYRNDGAFGNNGTGLAPIIKWPGGKEKELKYILPNTPKIDRYIEPFVGGGSVFMGICANEYLINDFSSELIDLYRYISTSDKDFFNYAYSIDNTWNYAYSFFANNTELIDIYVQYRKGVLDNVQLKTILSTYLNKRANAVQAILDVSFEKLPNILDKEIQKNIYRKMLRMKELEIKKHILPDKDLADNIETAIKSAVYMNFRYLYNDNKLTRENKALHCALFFFIRNYAYSGMFRYSSKGEFNVPYGGIAYNSKLLRKKLMYYLSEPLNRHFNKTKIFNLDFEEFLKSINPQEDDFIFLDPPYDSEFSTYAQNIFSKDDQVRLANYLLDNCKSRWMMIIKNTDFIYGLYDKPGIKIRTFEKEYLVSFMNRNDKKVTHLLITNY